MDSALLPIIETTVKYILLSNGSKVIVDSDDFEWLNQWKWRLSDRGYVIRTPFLGRVDGKDIRSVIRMHRLVCNTPEGMITDHINGNKLDNRRCNLRICTPAQNAWNVKPKANAFTKYKGVVWHKPNRVWTAKIKVHGITHRLGSFKCEHKAALAYNEAAKRLHGEFAYLNEVEQ